METTVKVRRQTRDGRTFYQLWWYDTGGKVRSRTLPRNTGKREALHQRSELQRSMDNGETLRDRSRAPCMTLEQLQEEYRERRLRGDGATPGRRGIEKAYVKIAPATWLEHQMTFRYLRYFFGDAHPIADIDKADAGRFFDALADQELAGARREAKRQYTAGDNTVRKNVSNAKTIFGWALQYGYLRSNPFLGFSGQRLAGKANAEVGLATFYRVLRAAGHQWRAFLALQRLGGLRREEARTLPWSGTAKAGDGSEHRVGVDFDRGRICLVATKTRRYREAPICPRLAKILARAFDAAAPGSQRPAGSISRNNLTRLGQELVRRAGVSPWPKLYQALRSSCENAWKVDGVPEPTYTAWLGHSVRVSRESYVAPTDAEFGRVSGK